MLFSYVRISRFSRTFVLFIRNNFSFFQIIRVRYENCSVKIEEEGLKNRCDWDVGREQEICKVVRLSNEGSSYDPLRFNRTETGSGRVQLRCSICCLQRLWASLGYEYRYRDVKFIDPAHYHRIFIFFFNRIKFTRDIHKNRRGWTHFFFTRRKN